jgi:hypothetical protein
MKTNTVVLHLERAQKVVLARLWIAGTILMALGINMLPSMLDDPSDQTIGLGLLTLTLIAVLARVSARRGWNFAMVRRATSDQVPFSMTGRRWALAWRIVVMFLATRLMLSGATGLVDDSTAQLVTAYVVLTAVTGGAVWTGMRFGWNQANAQAFHDLPSADAVDRAMSGGANV